MKFSYTFLKQLVPAIKNKNELIEKLTMHAFEAEDAAGDAVEVKLPPNRYSDAGGHWGLARDISAVYGKTLKFQNTKPGSKIQSVKSNFQIKIDNNFCPRYTGQYFENIKIGPSPKWMQKILADCGSQSINAIVDIMNYVMLETGQPLHAFDYDKIESKSRESKNIYIRRARKNEKITTLDNREIMMSEDNLIIADDKEALAIAGIKGGKKAEIDKNTKRIIVEAANFDAANIYQSSRRLNLTTDASFRFSHSLSPESTMLALNRAGELLQKFAQASPGAIKDIYPKKQPKKIIRFGIDEFNKFVGLNFGLNTAKDYLISLGFVVKKSDSRFLTVEVPSLRLDIENTHDLFEEIVRLYGYDNLKPFAPSVHLRPTGFEDSIVLKDKIRNVLSGWAINETQNYSFISQSESDRYFSHFCGSTENKSQYHSQLVELENPFSAEFQYLRPCLAVNLIKNVIFNSRLEEEISYFEIGDIFFQRKLSDKPTETPTLGIIMASKNKETFFHLKGVVVELLKKIGVVDYLLAPAGGDNWVKEMAGGYLEINNSLKIEVGNQSVIGYAGKLKKHAGLENWHASVLELDIKKLLDYVSGENEYRPLPKYPSVMRDISVLAGSSEKAGDIMSSIQEENLQYIDDVDFIDEYQKNGRRSLTFRIVFQAEDRTLTDKEVNDYIERIQIMLVKKFKVAIR